MRNLAGASLGGPMSTGALPSRTQITRPSSRPTLPTKTRQERLSCLLIGQVRTNCLFAFMPWSGTGRVRGADHAGPTTEQVVARNGTGHCFEIQCLLSRLSEKKDGLADARCSANAACLPYDTRCVTATGHRGASGSSLSDLFVHSRAHRSRFVACLADETASAPGPDTPLPHLHKGNL